MREGKFIYQLRPCQLLKDCCIDFDIGIQLDSSIMFKSVLSALQIFVSLDI